MPGQWPDHIYTAVYYVAGRFVKPSSCAKREKVRVESRGREMRDEAISGQLGNARCGRSAGGCRRLGNGRDRGWGSGGWQWWANCVWRPRNCPPFHALGAPKPPCTTADTALIRRSPRTLLEQSCTTDSLPPIALERLGLWFTWLGIRGDIFLTPTTPRMSDLRCRARRE